ncbi:chromosome 11 open reading frame 44 [Homo sapiens]|nr:RecName: Full=Uncharacterized protein C11orf44; Flags: Precursor [Homo sapiens]EAW67791.1 chromosome 11 open reading frame 44 [Homo sapiens]BAC04771.1 unnamed protein product [Homo sapiens]|eukprot:NP_001258912.1 uncharacterized protein C11orf44 precursor [Homo sapiens]
MVLLCLFLASLAATPRAGVTGAWPTSGLSILAQLQPSCELRWTQLSRSSWRDLVMTTSLWSLAYFQHFSQETTTQEQLDEMEEIPRESQCGRQDFHALSCPTASPRDRVLLCCPGWRAMVPS